MNGGVSRSYVLLETRDILSGLHGDPVQRFPFPLQLFLVWLCYLIFAGSAVSDCLSIIQQRIRLVNLLFES